MENVFVNVFITSLISVTLGYFASKLASKRKLKIVRIIGYILLISLITSGIIFISSTFGPNSITKRKLDGLWIEKYSSNSDVMCYYGLSQFDMDKWTGIIKFRGDAFNETGKNVGSWESEYSILEGRTFKYFYRGTSKNIKTNDKDRKGTGEIKFTISKDEFIEGNGFYRASYKDSEERLFSIIKYTKNKDTISIILKNSSMFIRNWHKKHRNDTNE